jgi:hypothetical protein
MDPNTIALTLQQIDNLTAEARRRQHAHQVMAMEVAAMLARSSREVEALTARRHHLMAGLQSGSQP